MSTLRLFLPVLLTLLVNETLFSQNTFPSTGPVGIGTTTPAAQLDVRLSGISTPQYGLLLHTPTFGTEPNAQSSYFLRMVDDGNGQTKFIVQGDGSVGINTGTPTHALTVGGDIYTNGTMIVDGGDVLIARQTYAYGYVIRPNVAGYKNMAFAVAGGGPLDNLQVISNLSSFSGQVGIGTSTPGSNALAVEGSIGARKVIVTLANPFPDYVFKPGYSLPSLNSLSRYIKANHHLPEMPSADSVEKKGLDLGSNQTLLLKKIEELTLYVLQQQKELTALKKKIRQLDKKSGNK